MALNVWKSAALYFGIVFGAGFLFGVIRTLWVVPLVGVMWAELLEAPLMLAVIVVAARSVVRRFELASRPVALAVGLVALALLLCAELSLVLGLREMSLDEYFASRDTISGAVYLLMLIAFALMPLVAAWKGERAW